MRYRPVISHGAKKSRVRARGKTGDVGNDGDEAASTAGHKVEGVMGFGESDDERREPYMVTECEFEVK